MSEDLKEATDTKEEEVVEQPVVEEKAEPSVPELNPVEEQAMEQGWVPLEQWKEAGRDANEWRPAKEFVERGELYKSIHTTKRELKQTQAALDALRRHHGYVFKKAHEQALRDLKAEKRLAIRNEDFERLEEIETEIEETQDQFKKEQEQFVQEQTAAAQANQVAPEFQVWLDRNPWYLTDKSLRDEAEAAGFIYLNNGGTKDGLLRHVEQTIKRKFPKKFGVKQAAPNAVAAVNREARKPKADTINLSSEERKIMQTFVDMGVMSEADYIAELKKAGR